MEQQYIDMITTICVAILSSTGLWGVLETRRRKMIQKCDEAVKSDENMKELLIALARVQICDIGMRFIERGYIYQDEADVLEHLFTPYKQLGGNGNGEYIYKQAMSLPRKTSHKEEETEQD